MNAASAIRTSGFWPWIEIGDFRIQSYFVVISLVLCLCAVWIPRRALSRNLPAKFALDLFIAAMAGGFIGSRLLHIVWEEPAYYLEEPMRVFDFMAGGFVWYGGFFGALLAIALVLKVNRDHEWRRWLDFFSPVAAFGYAGGRIACVLTGCCFGKICEWPAHDQFFFPTQALAVFWELAAGALILWLEKNQIQLARDWSRKPLSPGGLFYLWLVLHGSGRLIMEAGRADPRGPSLGLLTISSVVSLGLICLGTFSLLKSSSRN